VEGGANCCELGRFAEHHGIVVLAFMVVIVVCCIIIICIVIGIIIWRVVVACSNFAWKLAFSASKSMCCGGGVMGRGGRGVVWVGYIGCDKDACLVGV